MCPTEKARCGRNEKPREYPNFGILRASAAGTSARGWTCAPRPDPISMQALFVWILERSAKIVPLNIERPIRSATSPRRPLIALHKEKLRALVAGF